MYKNTLNTKKTGFEREKKTKFFISKMSSFTVLTAAAFPSSDELGPTVLWLAYESAKNKM